MSPNNVTSPSHLFTGVESPSHCSLESCVSCHVQTYHHQPVHVIEADSQPPLVLRIIINELTLQTMAVFAPSLAAITHWFAPFPPNPLLNLLPWMVSPGLGSLGT